MSCLCLVFRGIRHTLVNISWLDGCLKPDCSPNKLSWLFRRFGTAFCRSEAKLLLTTPMVSSVNFTLFLCWCWVSANPYGKLFTMF